MSRCLGVAGFELDRRRALCYMVAVLLWDVALATARVLVGALLRGRLLLRGLQVLRVDLRRGWL